MTSKNISALSPSLALKNSVLTITGMYFGNTEMDEVNSLKLNDAKTDFLVLGTQQQLNKIMDINIRIGEDIIEPTEFIRNCGLILIANWKALHI